MSEITKNPLLLKREPVIKNGDDKLQLTTFCDGSQFIVKKEWINEHRILKEEVIFGSSDMFHRYIMPLLAGDKIRVSDSDEKHELHEIMREVKKYDIKLTLAQEYDIACNCGLTKMLSDINEYILEHEKRAQWRQKNYKNRVNAFVPQWNNYVQLFIKLHPESDDLQRLSGADLFNYIRENKINEMVHLNFLYDNFVFVFCEWFIKIVIEKHNLKEMQDFTLKLSLDSNILAPFSNIVDTISGVFSSIGAMVPKGVQDVVMGKVQTAFKLDELLTKKKE